jgi:hypothetical protein
MSSSPVATTMSRHEINDLLQKIRRSNAYHSRLAQAAATRIPTSQTPKARNRAQALNLSISVEAASKLDQKFISTIPLPFLDSAPSPPSETDHARFSATDATVLPGIVAPVPTYPSQTGAGGLAKEIIRPARPLLRYMIPSRVMASHQQDVVSSAPEYSLTSRWSASTTGTGETNEREDEEDGASELEIPQPAPIGVRYPSGDDDIENLDILVSPDDDDHPFIPVPSEMAEVQPQGDSLRPPLPTRIPLQAAPVQQVPEESPALAYFSSGSDSSQSSGLELVTPVTAGGELPIIRIKRKSLVDNVNREEDYYMVVEKRPKYERKVLTISTAERRDRRRTASSSRKNV